MTSTNPKGYHINQDERKERNGIKQNVQGLPYNGQGL